MANLQRNFIAGVMNKSLDERLLPNGQYVDALNVRLGSTEETEVGSVENTKGNLPLTALEVDGEPLSSSAKCIGAYEDGGNETIYWFVHDNSFTPSPINKLDLIVSLNVQTNILTYHVISMSNASSTQTTLNFNPSYLITGVNLVDEELLFFTDNINPPRFINVNRNYPNPIGFIDQFSAESLLVIKKPPRTSPAINLLAVASENNFLEDRFVCFGYRYQYADGEFSATSQFSEPAFLPRPFRYDFGVGLNDGMLNAINFANITYNSGGPLVTAVELLWKDMNNGSIQVIERLDKALLNIANDTDYTYEFSDSKVFTLLPSSEILRLYDNVPRLAQAQTIMGNRLIYGNYLEQYDLITSAGAPVQLNYTIDLISDPIGVSNVDDQTSSGTYTFGNSGVPISYQNSIVTFLDIDNLDLIAGAVLDFEINFTHLAFSGPNQPTATTPTSAINFLFILPRDYTSANDLATSQEFIDRIGTIAGGGAIQTVANSCNGTTATDEFNCIIPNTLDTLTKFESGRTAAGQPLTITSSPGNPNIGFQLNAMRFVDDPTGVAITQEAFEYYQVTSATCTFQSVGDPKSLKSNRSYEVGIIYMDEFNRASTALVSQNNTIHVPCSESDSKNSIQATIPTSQLAPSWAKRYKFCIKQDKEDYFNVYSSFFFTDPATQATYFLLEGQNSQKVQVGDILQVKTDTTGPLERCAFATVLEKESQLKDFLGEDNPPLVPGTTTPIPIPSGVYMKMRATNFTATFEENAVVNFGERSSKGSGCRIIYYPVWVDDGSGAATTYTIPAGSRIRIVIDNFRQGKGGVPRRQYFTEGEFTASQLYTDFKAWFDGDNVAAALTNLGSDSGTGVTGINYDNNMNALFPSCNCCAIFTRFYDNLSPANSLYFGVKSSEGYSGSKKNVRLKVNIEVIRTTAFVAFETKPQDAVPDLWYISSDSFPIAGSGVCEFNLSVDTAEPNPIQFDYTDINGNPASVIVNDGDSLAGIVGLCGSMVVSSSTPPVDASNITIDSFNLPQGAHVGNVTNQFGGFGGNNDAVINTSFFNCYSFGNGIESFQVLDEVAGKVLTLGNQVTSTSSQEYTEVHRFADLTYSGVFNDESNINKLNEFNLGLLNFKALEEEFGLVMKLDGRETDVLCLQEDKISYVLAGKNLLSDATGGGAVTSVPEVLGTQIARIEEYGISFNPESFAKWGSNKFFTDAKRGAVLQLKGTTAQNEQLIAISEAGMRSWFRDLFIDNFNTQKLGGYDPYMNEYVLSSNDDLLPEIVECIDCGITRTLNITETNPSNFCSDVGTEVGDVTISWTVVGGSGDNFEVEGVFNGVSVTSGPTAVSGSITVNKNVVTPEKVNVFIAMQTTGNVVLDVTVSCPAGEVINIIQVCVSKDESAGLKIHNEYDWNDGVVQSPTTSVGVTLASGNSQPLVSQYSLVSGAQGSIAPPNGSSVRIISNRIQPGDDFLFSPAVDNFRYLRTNTLYVNTPANISALISASNNAQPITGAGNTYRAAFVMPNTAGEYLYLIYDYRNAEEVELCYDANTSFAACCECGDFTENLRVRQCREDVTFIEYVISQTQGLIVGDFCELNGFGNCVFEVIETTTDPTTATLSQVRNDITDCTDVCQQYTISNNLGAAATIFYNDCNGAADQLTVNPGNSTTVCLTNVTALTGNLSYSLSDCDCPGSGELQFYRVRMCRVDGIVNEAIIQDNANQINVGNFVEISTFPNCVFEVMSLDVGPANATVTQILSIRGCSSFCPTYSLTNTSNLIKGVDYVDCDNQAAIINVPPLSTVQVCARDFVSLDADINLILSQCLCTVTE